MYCRDAAFWRNREGRLCCDIINKRWHKAWRKHQWAKARYYADQQQSRILRSDPNG